MREIETHKVNGCNEDLAILVMDEPGSGGACHHYRAQWPVKKAERPTIAELEAILAGNGGVEITPDGSVRASGRVDIVFQNGPIKESGVNGVTHEALLAIVIDRLTSFQAGPFACAENADALSHCQAAVERLKDRTRARLARGVEGTHAK